MLPGESIVGVDRTEIKVHGKVMLDWELVHMETRKIIKIPFMVMDIPTVILGAKTMAKLHIVPDLFRGTLRFMPLMDFSKPTIQKIEPSEEANSVKLLKAELLRVQEKLDHSQHQYGSLLKTQTNQQIELQTAIKEASCAQDRFLAIADERDALETRCDCLQDLADTER